MTPSNPKPSLDYIVDRIISMAMLPEDAAHPIIKAEVLAFAQAVAAESQPRWIPVTEKVPEIPDGCDHVEVLVFRVNEYGDEQILTDYFYEGADGWADDCITHWQPIPPAPTEEQS